MTSQINIQIELAEDKMPETIQWMAPDGGVDEWQKAKAILLGLWDGDNKEAMRIDLWTSKMMVDEMNDFFGVGRIGKFALKKLQKLIARQHEFAGKVH